MTSEPQCSLGGCVKPAKHRGWCGMHYERWRRHGDPHVTLSPQRAADTTLEQALKAKTVRTESGCDEWTGTRTRKGYGLVSVHGTMRSTHRVAYEVFVGPIPDGIEIDHRCGNHACINAAHLRHATRNQNMQNLSRLRVNNQSGVRGVHWSAQCGKWRAKVTHQGKAIHVGLFADLAEAEAAVITKRNELFTHNDADRLATA